MTRTDKAEEHKRFADLTDALADAGFTVAAIVGDDHMWMVPNTGMPRGHVITDRRHLTPDAMPDRDHLFFGYVLGRLASIPEVVGYFIRLWAISRGTPADQPPQ